MMEPVPVPMTARRGRTQSLKQCAIFRLGQAFVPESIMANHKVSGVLHTDPRQNHNGVTKPRDYVHRNFKNEA